MTTILPNLPVSPLRQKLIDDMTMRHFSVAIGFSRASRSSLLRRSFFSLFAR